MDPEVFIRAALQVAERATDPEHREAALAHLAAEVDNGESGSPDSEEDDG